LKRQNEGYGYLAMMQSHFDCKSKKNTPYGLQAKEMFRVSVTNEKKHREANRVFTMLLSDALRIFFAC